MIMVEWKKLDTCLDFEQPTPYLVKSTEYDDSYDTPVLTAGQSLLLGYTNEKDGIYRASKKRPCIIFDDFTTSFHWIDYDFKVKSSAMKMLRPKDNINFRYVYYAMLGINYTPGGHQRHWISKYSQFEIPLPSHSEQQHIVEILDTFNSSIENLRQQITQRRKQYDYYRDKILESISKEWPCATLKDVAVIKNGKDYKNLLKGNVPVYGSGGVMTYVNEFASNKPSVLLPRKGSVENIFYVEEPFWTVDTIYWTDIDTSKVLPKYLFYSLLMYNLKDYAYGGARPSLSQPILYKLEILLPSLSEQQRIVSILDTFEASIANLEAQLAQREKQYEYYRNKLLTFE